jgi:hypothetical protein
MPKRQQVMESFSTTGSITTHIASFLKKAKVHLLNQEWLRLTHRAFATTHRALTRAICDGRQRRATQKIGSKTALISLAKKRILPS